MLNLNSYTPKSQNIVIHKRPLLDSPSDIESGLDPEVAELPRSNSLTYMDLEDSDEESDTDAVRARPIGETHPPTKTEIASAMCAVSTCVPLVGTAVVSCLLISDDMIHPSDTCRVSGIASAVFLFCCCAIAAIKR